MEIDINYKAISFLSVDGTDPHVVVQFNNYFKDLFDNGMDYEITHINTDFSRNGLNHAVTEMIVVYKIIV